MRWLEWEPAQSVFSMHDSGAEVTIDVDFAMLPQVLAGSLPGSEPAGQLPAALTGSGAWQVMRGLCGEAPAPDAWLPGAYVVLSNIRFSFKNAAIRAGLPNMWVAQTLVAGGAACAAPACTAGCSGGVAPGRQAVSAGAAISGAVGAAASAPGVASGARLGSTVNAGSGVNVLYSANMSSEGLQLPPTTMWSGNWCALAHRWTASTPASSG